MSDLEDTPSENIHVQLTRMEGKSDLIAYKVDNLIEVSKGHESRISGMEIALQHLQDEFHSTTAAALATSTAVRLAEESRTRAAEARWSPWQRVLVAISGLTAVAMTVIAIFK